MCNRIEPDVLIGNVRICRFKNSESKHVYLPIEIPWSLSETPLRFLWVGFAYLFTLISCVFHGPFPDWFELWVFRPTLSFLLCAVVIASAPTWLRRGNGAFKSEVHEGAGGTPAMPVASGWRIFPSSCYLAPRPIRPPLASSWTSG
jgi:hypothetical protein